MNAILLSRHLLSCTWNDQDDVFRVFCRVENDHHRADNRSWSLYNYSVYEIMDHAKRFKRVYGDQDFHRKSGEKGTPV